MGSGRASCHGGATWLGKPSAFQTGCCCCGCDPLRCDTPPPPNLLCTLQGFGDECPEINGTEILLEYGRNPGQAYWDGCWDKGTIDIIGCYLWVQVACVGWDAPPFSFDENGSVDFGQPSAGFRGNWEDYQVLFKVMHSDSEAGCPGGFGGNPNDFYQQFSRQAKNGTCHPIYFETDPIALDPGIDVTGGCCENFCMDEEQFYLIITEAP
jgi:hypothetical protein